MLAIRALFYFVVVVYGSGILKSLRAPSLSLGQWHNSPSVSYETMKSMNKQIAWIHY